MTGFDIRMAAYAAYDKGETLSDNPYNQTTDPENHWTWENAWLACRDIEVRERY